MIYVESASDFARHQKAFRDFDSIDELTNGVAPRELKPDELGEINHLLQRDYRKITLYEVELNESAAFFEVSYGDDTYDSRTMGSGEAAALHIWWRLTSAAPDTIIIVEEPEAFLSSACQHALADFLISKIVSKRLCAVIGTHSPPLISSIPKDGWIFLTRGRSGLQVVGNQAPPILLRSVGIEPAMCAVLLVEDNAAIALCKLILEKLDPELARRVAIEVRNGEAEVTSALRLTYSFKIPLTFIGVYDGDVGDQIPADIEGYATVLPGDQPIEKILRAMVTENSASLGQLTQRGDLHVILNALEGADHHNWYEDVAKELGLSKDQLFFLLFSIWIGLPGNSDITVQCYERIAALVLNSNSHPD